MCKVHFEELFLSESNSLTWMCNVLVGVICYMTSDASHKLLQQTLASKQLEILYILLMILFEMKIWVSEESKLFLISFFSLMALFFLSWLFLFFLLLKLWITEFLNYCHWTLSFFLHYSISLVSFSLYSLSSLFFSLNFLNIDAPLLIAFSFMVTVGSASHLFRGVP